MENVWDLCDDLCALCDNGGEVLCCEGRCLRSFHASVEAGFPSGCKSLGLSSEKVTAMENFVCMNCQNKQHQCFACGKLGSSRSNNPEVFQCAALSCGHFYHPRCFAKLLHPINEHAAEQVKDRIIAGEPFTCTVHKCSSCKQEEDENVEELQFAICRRCPKVYHRKCLPSGISLESSMDEGILQRAWDDLIPNRLVIYCLKHEIDVRTLAPQGIHIVFPDVLNKKKMCFPNLQPGHGKMLTKKSSVDCRNHPKIVSGNPSKECGKAPSVIKGQSSTAIHLKQGSREGFGYKKSSQAIDASRLHVKNKFKRRKVCKSSGLDEANLSMKKKCSTQMLNRSFAVDTSKQKSVPCGISKKPVRVEPILKRSNCLQSSVRTEAEINGMDFMKGNSSSKTPTETSRQTYPCNKTGEAIPKGSVSGSVKAVDTSMQKLEDYNEREANHQTMTFSIATKAKITDTLLCYAKPGDLIVNFYCHANDFSNSTREKCEETTKKCSVKNYDVFQWKEFDFRKSIQMPTGSRLITGLIFPSEADPIDVSKFVDKVLVFKPKLLLLICPRGTKRLKQDECEYDLVWEEDEPISCKSYIRDRKTLEGTIICLWSRGDWTGLHKSIELNEGYISRLRNETDLEDETNGSGMANYINNTTVENSKTEYFAKSKEIVCDESVDVCVVKHCIQDEFSIPEDQGMDYHHDRETAFADVSDSEPVLKQPAALLAKCLLPFSDKSCGWVEE